MDVLKTLTKSYRFFKGLWEVNPTLYSLHGQGSVAIFSWFLGFCFCAGLWMFFEFETAYAFGLYFTLLSFFHVSEWFTVATFNPRELSADSFLLNHSTPYIIACSSAFLEFWVEWYFFPWLKQSSFLIFIGFVVSFTGITLRLVGMITAKQAFTHLVKDTKRNEHILVDWGVYRHIRHPGYLGWFYWTIFSQVLIANPICTIGFAFASWSFFADRIPGEEEALMDPDFFGERYKAYRDKTPTFIPFIN